MSPRHSRSTSGNKLLSSKYILDSVRSQREALRTAGIDPTPALLESIATYIELLLRWNLKVNLTAITDPQEMVTRNFAESFMAARWLTTAEGRLCDVGSGAGFPGLALKLLLPHWRVILLEPTVKKAAFLAEAARTLGLQNVEVARCRWEEAGNALGIESPSLDALTSRALGGYDELAEWAASHLKPGGRLILWLGEQDAQELESLNGWIWERRSVSGSRARVLLAGTRS